MFRRILLATDFSAGAETAKQLTETLMDGGDAPDLLVVTVLELSREWPEEGMFVVSDQAEEHERKKFTMVCEEALVDYMRSLKNRGITADHRILEGDPAQRILACASEWNADLLVLGATGKRSGSELSLGKTARAILRRSTLPVLIAAHRSG